MSLYIHIVSAIVNKANERKDFGIHGGDAIE
jgi:hypothetical protein